MPAWMVAHDVEVRLGPDGLESAIRKAQAVENEYLGMQLDTAMAEGAMRRRIAAVAAPSASVQSTGSAEGDAAMAEIADIKRRIAAGTYAGPAAHAPRRPPRASNAPVVAPSEAFATDRRSQADAFGARTSAYLDGLLQSYGDGANVSAPPRPAAPRAKSADELLAELGTRPFSMEECRHALLGSNGLRAAFQTAERFHAHASASFAASQTRRR